MRARRLPPQLLFAARRVRGLPVRVRARLGGARVRSARVRRWVRRARRVLPRRVPLRARLVWARMRDARVSERLPPARSMPRRRHVRVCAGVRRARLRTTRLPSRLLRRRRVPADGDVRVLPRARRRRLRAALVPPRLLRPRRLRQWHVLVLRRLRRSVVPAAHMPLGGRRRTGVLGPRRVQGDDVLMVRQDAHTASSAHTRAHTRQHTRWKALAGYSQPR